MGSDELQNRIKKINDLKYDYFPTIEQVHNPKIRIDKSWILLSDFVLSGSQCSKEKLIFQIIITIFMVIFLDIELFDFQFDKIYVDRDENVVFVCFDTRKKRTSSLSEIFDYMKKFSKKEQISKDEAMVSFVSELIKKKQFIQTMLGKSIQSSQSI